MDVDNKGLSQLLLSPLYLFDQTLSTVIPGALFMLLLGLKGNVLLRAFWYQSPLGYKTKIAAFCLLAFVVGHFIKLPLFLITTLRQMRKKEDISGLTENLKKQTPEVRTMLKGMILDGALLAMPGLLDRLSLIKADAGFYLGTGLAFTLAAAFPGDSGSARWVEATFGFALLWVGIAKGREYTNHILSTVGIGLANVVGKMTPEQVRVSAALFKAFLEAPTPNAPPIVNATESTTPPAPGNGASDGKGVA